MLHGARRLAAGDGWGGTSLWIGCARLSVGGARAVIGWGERPEAVPLMEDVPP